MCSVEMSNHSFLEGTFTSGKIPVLHLGKERLPVKPHCKDSGNIKDKTNIFYM